MPQYLKRFQGGPNVNPFLPAEWANTVNRFLETFRVVEWDGAYPFVDRANGDGSDWTIYIPSTSSAAAFPWQCYFVGSDLYIRPGTWTRNYKYRCTLDGGPSDPQNIGPVSPGDVVCLLLDDKEKPTSVSVITSGTLPPDDPPSSTDNRYLLWVLGYVDPDGAWVQLWWGGDITDHYQYPVTWENDPLLSASDDGPPQSSPCGTLWCQDDTHSPYLQKGLDPYTLQLCYFGRPIDVQDGRADFAAYGGIGTLSVDLSDWFSGLVTTADLGDAIEAWLNANGSTWVEANIPHSGLSDMPDVAGTNTDHDARYWMHAGTAEGNPDSKSYKTSAALEAGSVAINGAAGNMWDAAGFAANVSGDVSLTVDGDFKIDGHTGRTVMLACTDPDTGTPVLVKVHKGAIVIA